MSWLGDYFHKLAQGFKGGGIALADIDGTIQHLFTSVDTTILNVKNEVTAFRDFQFDPKWSSRVINAPIAIEQTRNFVLDTVDTVRDDFEQLKADVQAVQQVFRDLQAQGTTSGIGAVVNFINEINTFLEALVNAVDRFQNLVDMVRQIRQEVAGLDSLFLQQGNSRKISREKSKIRVGNLHA